MTNDTPKLTMAEAFAAAGASASAADAAKKAAWGAKRAAAGIDPSHSCAATYGPCAICTDI